MSPQPTWLPSAMVELSLLWFDLLLTGNGRRQASAAYLYQSSEELSLCQDPSATEELTLGAGSRCHHVRQIHPLRTHTACAVLAGQDPGPTLLWVRRMVDPIPQGSQGAKSSPERQV